MALVRLRRAAQITLPQGIREAAHLKEGDYLEAEVTESGTILLKPVDICSGLQSSVAGLAIIANFGSRSVRLSEATGSRSVIPGSRYVRRTCNHRRRLTLCKTDRAGRPGRKRRDFLPAPRAEPAPP